MSERTKQLNELQDIFNKYIRLRDYGKLCITCQTVLRNNYDAGHCFSIGAYPELRLDEDNVHGQCEWCNRFKGGLTTTYQIRLINRIGTKRIDELQARIGKPLKLTLPEIKDLKKHYRSKIREIEKSISYQ